MSERKTLTINRRTWHGRVYNAWAERYSNFKSPDKKISVYDNENYYVGEVSRYRENLCHYVRVVLFWCPINWFFRGKQAVKNGSTEIDSFRSFVTSVPPIFQLILLSGIVLYGASWFQQPLKTGAWTGAILAGICLLIGGVILATYINDHKDEWAYNRRNKAELKGLPVVQKDPSIFHVMWDFTKAKKHKVCPLIEIEED